jgi:hypothetical protein
MFKIPQFATHVKSKQMPVTGGETLMNSLNLYAKLSIIKEL